MKKFTKLALVSSIALTTNAMAMQAMDDTALSATTGQDGLSIGIGISKIEIEKLLIHDNDGLAAKVQLVMLVLVGLVMLVQLLSKAMVLMVTLTKHMVL